MKVDAERPRVNPFHEFLEAAEDIRHHYRELSKTDFENTLLRMNGSPIAMTVVSPGLTETPALAILGLTPETTPMKPMKVEQCVSEAIRGLAANRSLVIPGLMNRIMNAIVPASVTRTMMAKLFEKSLATRSASRQTEAERYK